MKSRAQKVINWIIAAPFLLLGAALVVALLYFVYCEIIKAYWDYKVKQWCKKDGGVTIYEKVVIFKDDYKNLKTHPNGDVMLPFEDMAKPDDPFFVRHKSEDIQKGLIGVRKGTILTVRNSDKKILSAFVSYSRGGGDFPTGFDGSQYSCELDGEEAQIFSSTVVVKGE